MEDFSKKGGIIVPKHYSWICTKCMDEKYPDGCEEKSIGVTYHVSCENCYKLQKPKDIHFVDWEDPVKTDDNKMFEAIVEEIPGPCSYCSDKRTIKLFKCSSKYLDVVPRYIYTCEKHLEYADQDTSAFSKVESFDSWYAVAKKLLDEGNTIAFYEEILRDIPTRCEHCKKDFRSLKPATMRYKRKNGADYTFCCDMCTPERNKDRADYEYEELRYSRLIRRINHRLKVLRIEARENNTTKGGIILD